MYEKIYEWIDENPDAMYNYYYGDEVPDFGNSTANREAEDYLRRLCEREFGYESYEAELEHEEEY